MLLQLDELLQSEAFKKEHLGDKFSKYEYVSILKQGAIEGSPPFFKLKLLYDTENTIQTKIYKSSLLDGKRLKEELDCKSIDDVATLVPFRSKVRIIFKPSTVWKQSASLKAPLYGLTLRACKIEVRESEPPPPLNAGQCEFVESDCD